MNYVTKVALLCVGVCGLIEMKAAGGYDSPRAKVQVTDMKLDLPSGPLGETMLAMAEYQAILERANKWGKEITYNEKRRLKIQICPRETKRALDDNFYAIALLAQRKLE